jgi:hypothetical protein
LSPITFALLRPASGRLDESQAAASGMTVGKQEVFLNVAEIGDILAHAGSSERPRSRRSLVCSCVTDHWTLLLETKSK